MADYNEYYQSEDLFGEAYPELVKFFSKYEPKGKVVDLGCGQGRDAVPLARLGYNVTGVDNSEVGIKQMLEKADKENLKITGLVDDIYSFKGYESFNIVLLDSMFHFEKRDMPLEKELIVKIANEIRESAIICIFIQDTGAKVKILKETIKNTKLDFDIINDSSLIYKYEDKESGHSSVTKYCMYIVKKTSHK